MPAAQVISLGIHGQLSLAATPDAFPLGARGQRPVTLYLRPDAFRSVHDATLTDYADEHAGIVKQRPNIPGAQIRGTPSQGGTIQCSWDCAYALARHHLPLEAARIVIGEFERLSNIAIPLPGLARYQALGIKAKRRDYQQVAALFLLRRAWSILGDPPRSGKCFSFIIIPVLLDYPKTMILCTKMGKRGWADDCWKWVQEEAFLCYGKGGRDGRVHCGRCKGYRVIGDDKTPCDACVGPGGKPLGYKQFLVRDLEPVTQAHVWYDPPSQALTDRYEARLRDWQEKRDRRLTAWREEEEKKRLERETRAIESKKPLKRLEPSTEPEVPQPPEAPKGTRRQTQVPVSPPLYRCPVHQDEVDNHARRCRICQDQFDAAFAQARFVICNYDLLTPHKEKDHQGGIVIRADLPGWAPLFAKHHWQLAGLDEAHRIGDALGNTKKDKEAMNRREHVMQSLAGIPQVVAITGTPVRGYTRQVWGVLDLISEGLFS